MLLNRITVRILTPALAVWFLSFSALVVAQTRPSAADLLPQETVVYVQIPDIQALKEDFANTGFGRMMADERVAPLVAQVYEELQNLYATQVEETIGVGLEELLSLPAGEICFAVVAPKRKSPAYVLLVDLSENSEAADTLINKGRELAENDGANLESEDESGFEINIINGSGDDEYVAYVRKDSTLVACTNREVLAGILARWAGTPPEKDRTLRDNRKFITIMNRCASVRDTKKNQLEFFIDPFDLINSALRGQAQRKFVLGILRTAGLDGLLAIGGSTLFDEQGYESIFHLHVSLSNPRKGVFKVVSLKPGHYQPEAWVPDDAITYMTSNWDVSDVYGQIKDIYQSYDPPSEWDTLIQENINDEMGFDFDEDVIGGLSGRLTYVSWNEPPARVNSQLNVLSIGLKDPDKFTDRILAAIENKLEEDDRRDALEIVDYNGIDIWRQAQDEDQAERRRTRMEEQGIIVDIRIPRPCMAIVGDSLLISESQKFLEHAIDTYRGNHAKLAEHERYSDVMRHMTRLLKTDMPSMVVYTRPDIQFRNLFELADDEGIKDFLRKASEDVEIAGGMLGALEDNPLPDFDDLVDYLAPSGAFITNDESGWHMLAFQIKSEKAKQTEDE